MAIRRKTITGPTVAGLSERGLIPLQSCSRPIDILSQLFRDPLSAGIGACFILIAARCTADTDRPGEVITNLDRYAAKLAA